MTDNLILEIIEKFNSGSISELTINQGSDTLNLKRGTGNEQTVSYKDSSVEVTTAVPAKTVETPVVEDAPVSVADDNFVIKSPIIGTFYRAPSPDAPSYVEVGTKVQKGQPLCILEAMKMMNTLECECNGTVVEILANTGDLIEFDQPIFVIKED